MRFPSHLLVAAGLVAIGVTALQKPRFASGQFGLPVKDKTGLAYVRGLGMRDIALGLLVLYSGPQRRVPLLVISMVGLSDFFTVSSTSENPPVQSLGTHALGFAGALALASLAGPRPAEAGAPLAVMDTMLTPNKRRIPGPHSTQSPSCRFSGGQR